MACIAMSFLTKKYILIIVFFFITIGPLVSGGYGYKRNEDPIITVFKSVIFYGSKDEWSRVESRY